MTAQERLAIYIKATEHQAKLDKRYNQSKK